MENPQLGSQLWPWAFPICHIANPPVRFPLQCNLEPSRCVSHSLVLLCVHGLVSWRHSGASTYPSHCTTSDLSQEGPG